ncbi:MAG: hypothetical protein OXC37_05500 [Bdellovibrionaceae bacterium]|nr:hypothetical protein [Pseudobdellovibrionaceae bacterium]
MIISNKSFKEFFHKELSPYTLPINIKNYLINLLYFYLNSEQFFEKKAGETKFHEIQLLEWYEKSLVSNTQEKLYLFKRMGDFSLYLSGFFRQAIRKKLTHLSYYQEMGQSAYHYVSQSYPPKSNVFTELSGKFKELSEILFVIQKRSVFQNQKKYFLNLKKLSNKKLV